MDEKTPEQQLAEIKSRRAALAAVRTKRDEQSAVDQQIAAEALELANELALEDAETSTGLKLGAGLAIVKTPDGDVILKRPSALIYRRFRDQGKYDHESILRLVGSCRVHPSADAFEALDTKYPGVLVRSLEAVSHLAGATFEAISGK